jgi:hypothetical protein
MGICEEQELVMEEAFISRIGQILSCFGQEKDYFWNDSGWIGEQKNKYSLPSKSLSGA